MANQTNKKSDKFFYEYKAKLILIKCFNEMYSQNLILDDKPDLQDITNSIGIEVTRAFRTNKIAEQQSLWKNHKILRVNKKSKNEYKKNHISYSCVKDKCLVMMFYPSTKYLIDSFIVKLNKLNDDLYIKFTYYDLFIFSHELKEFDMKDMPPLLDTMIMLQANSNFQYRIVYILDIDIIYCYNLLTKTFSTIRIDSNILDAINNQAKKEK